MQDLKKYLLSEKIEFAEDKGMITLDGDFYLPDGVDCSQLQSVGGSLYCRTATSIDLPQLQSVGGYLYCRTATSIDLPQLQSVGGYLYCRTEIKIGGKTFNIQIIDNLPGVLIGRPKTVDGFKIQKALIAQKFRDGVFNNNEICFIASKDGKNAHGKTVQQAIYDVEFKNIDREKECEKYKKYTRKTKLSVNEWYLVYRNITGACSTGAWSFINGGNFAGDYTLGQVIELTRGQYGHRDFCAFFRAKG